MRAKIALEEHFNVHQFDDKIPQYVNPLMMSEVKAKLLDVAGMRLQEMDAAGIGYSLLSLNSPGVQDVPDPEQAVTLARQVNDTLAEIVAGTPARYGGFATLPTQEPRAAVAGHPELSGAVWMFTVESATHALRLMTSGLFDRFPQLKVILGHLGETLTFNMWRIEHRISCMGDLRKFKRPLGHYLRTNFYVTTSGNFHDPALANALTELGAGHVLFSTDYPYESMREAADWFDNVEISESDREQIGQANARRLFRNVPEQIGSLVGAAHA